MATITNAKLKLMPRVSPGRATVSNFKKAVVSFNVNRKSLLRRRTCRIALFEIDQSAPPESPMLFIREETRNLTPFTQSVSIDFLADSSFPGPSLFEHFYIAFIIAANPSGSSEIVRTNIAKLGAAALVPVP